MNFGEPTDSQKLSLEQRSSAFFNLAGVRAQEVLNCSNEGISTRKIYKILANAIQDWHWLSFKDKEQFQFNGIGGLIWIPHRFGSLGLIRPFIQYNVTFRQGLFPDIPALVSTDEYAKYGCRAIRKGEHNRIVFAPDLSFEMLQKIPLEIQERHFWDKIVGIYARLDDDTLDALASCRNNVTSAHSLWIQFVHWQREMGKAFDLLREKDLNSMEEDEKKRTRNHIAGARACIHHIKVKIGYRTNIARFVDIVKDSITNPNLESYLPCLDAPDQKSYPSNLDFNNFVAVFEYLEALHEVCWESLMQGDIYERGEKADLEKLEQCLIKLSSLSDISNTLIDPKRWFTLLLPPKEKNKEIASLCLKLIKAVFGKFQYKLKVSFLYPTEHYNEFLTNYYPLPYNHFLPGF